MLKHRMIPLSLIGLLAISGCAVVPGDFCDVVSGPLVFASETAALIVATDRRTAERIDVQNRYGERVCEW